MKRSEIRGRCFGSKDDPAFRFAPCGATKIRPSIILLARQIVLRGLPYPSSGTREAERRQALGCSGTLMRANDVGPQARNVAPCIPRRAAYAVRAPGMLASRRSTAAIYWHPVPRGINASRRCRRFSVHWACEHLASARSGGGRGSGASRGHGYEPARRTPHPAPTLARLRRRPR